MCRRFRFFSSSAATCGGVAAKGSPLRSVCPKFIPSSFFNWRHRVVKNFDWRRRSLDWEKKGFCVFLAVAVLSVAQQTWRIFFVVVRRLFWPVRNLSYPLSNLKGDKTAFFVRNFAGGRGNVRGRENRVEWQPKEKRGEAWKWPQKWSREQL